MRHYVSIVLAALAVLLTTPRPASACLCAANFSGQPACQARWDFDAVFVGRVASIAHVRIPWSFISDGPSLPPDVSAARVEFDMLEDFSDRRTEPVVYSEESSCQYQFEADRTYLVYARRDRHGLLRTMYCDPTKPVAAAGEDLAYLRAIPRTPPRFGRIIGLALFVGPPGWDQRTPQPGVRVTAEGQGLRRTAVTDAQGRYSIPLPTGSYAISASPPGNRYAAVVQHSSSRVGLKDSRGCTVADFSVHDDGHLLGRAVTSSGAPIPYLWMRLRSIVQNGPEAVGQTDSGGRFDLSHLTPGRYRLIVPGGALTGSPPSVGAWTIADPAGDPLPIDVGPGAHVTLDRVVIPGAHRFATLRGTVVDALGGRLSQAIVEVRVSSPGAPVLATLRTDTTGGFAIALIEGVDYDVTVRSFIARDRWATATLTVRGGAAGPLTFVAIEK